MTTKTIRPGVTAATAAGPINPLPSRISPQAADPTGLTYDRSDIEESTTATAGDGWALTGRGQPVGDAQTQVMPAVTEQAAAGDGEPQGLPDDLRTWWFTFPSGHAFAGRYAATHGTHDAARAEVIAHFGETFVGQFASAEEAGVLRAGLLRLRRDQWLNAVDEPAAEDRGECPPCTTPQPASPGEAGPAAVEHFYARGWKGDGLGECGVECACGLVFDGFDSIRKASAFLERHIANPEADAPAEHTAPAAQLEDTTPAAGDVDEPTSEPRRVPAGELQPGMFVGSSDPDRPGLEVRHVERADDGAVVGVVFAGPQYGEFPADVLFDLVDEKTVEEAAARARARAHRAQQIEGLRELARLAEQDEFFPLPDFTLRVGGGMTSVEAVRRFAAAVDVPVTGDDHGVRAKWTYGGDDLDPAVQVQFSAPHKTSQPGGVR